MSDGRADALERLLLERLEGVASSPSGILQHALDLARLPSVPTDRIELALFCRGPLDEALAEALGPDAAEALVEELAILAQSLPDPESPVVESGTRRRPERRSGTRRRRDGLVVVVSRDAERSAAVVDALEERMETLVADDVFALMQATEANLDRSLVLVIDGTVPGLRGPMLMSLARILPPSAQVVFWGAPPPTGSIELDATALPPETTPTEIADLCVGGAAGADDDDEPPLDVILLADDDPVWRAALERRLRDEGYAVVSVADGFAALEAAIDHRPALVLTDFDMPTLDGQQLAALLVGRFGDDVPPIVMLTASEIGPVPGIARVISKSAPFEALLDAVRGYLPLDGSAALRRNTV